MFGGSMGHDWVFDMLRDLQAYALANGLPALAAKAGETLQVAEVEIAAQGAAPFGPGQPGHEPH